MIPRAVCLPLLALVALSACARSAPDDTVQGVGFGDYTQYQQGRAAAQAQLAGQPPQGSIAPTSSTAVTVAPPASTDPIAARAAAAIDAAETVQPSTNVAPDPVAPSSNVAISDEQDFEAVAARESIESDAERRQQMQDQLVVVAPTAVPERPNSTGPNIIEYALSTSHPVGQQVYRRSPLGQNRHEANCLSYQSADLAQQAFLASGGPERDRQALDPDGDGYACNWDPNVYRNAARGG